MLGTFPPRTGPYRVLAVSGSLRAQSSNQLVLNALAAAAPAPLQVFFPPGIETLPHFNPDLDAEDHRPDPVRAWRTAIAAADALVLSSPEYAHGVPGTLKNALDWLVSGPELPALPVGLLNTSPRASHAQDALVETLRTMSAELLTPPVWTVPLAGRPFTLEEVLADSDLAGPLHQLLQVLQTTVGVARKAGRRLVGAPAETESHPAS